jgi:hypothetical protein
VAREVYWRDKRWFEARPEAIEYERDYVEGEFWFEGDDYVDPTTIRRVRVSIMDMFEDDPPVRGSSGCERRSRQRRRTSGIRMPRMTSTGCCRTARSTETPLTHGSAAELGRVES